VQLILFNTSRWCENSGFHGDNDSSRGLAASVVMWYDTNVSENLAASIFRVKMDLNYLCSATIVHNLPTSKLNLKCSRGYHTIRFLINEMFCMQIVAFSNFITFQISKCENLFIVNIKQNMGICSQNAVLHCFIFHTDWSSLTFSKIRHHLHLFPHCLHKQRRL
jgi:hypothetical protein